MNPWKGRLMVTVFLLLISINADASETPKSPAGFQRYYEKVRSHYPVLKRQHADVQKTLASKLESHAGLLPSLSGNFQIDTTDDPSAVFSHKLKQETFQRPGF